MILPTPKLLMCCLVVLSACSSESSVDVQKLPPSKHLVKNVTVIDGSGSKGYTADVRFDSSGIIAVGKLESTDDDEVVFAQGLVLAPGFIDTHSHHLRGISEAPQAVAAISQGITTIVAGNDGVSEFPLESLKQKIQSNPATINVASYTGHGSIRFEVMGADYKREATEDEVTRMQALLDQDMVNGSLGLATGLEYDPGIYSSSAEVIALAKTSAAKNGRYISHMRSEDRAFHEAVDELIQIGREAQLPVQISHMKLAAVNIWGQVEPVLQKLEAARSEGINVTADVYPYTYWQSTLTVLLPDRDFNDLEAARFALENLAPANGLTLTAYAPDPDLVGMTVEEIATARGKSNEETYLQLIRDAYEGLTAEDIADLEQSPESVIGVSMDEQDVADLVAWQHSNICSDGSSDGHPRGHGAFPRAIRLYVREQGILSLPEMIRKMTSLSAEHVGIEGRGLIAEGMAADLVLFNPKTIGDNATIAQHDLLSDGIVNVWVNGELVWQDQQATDARPGVFVSRATQTGH